MARKAIKRHKRPYKRSGSRTTTSKPKSLTTGRSSMMRNLSMIPHGPGMVCKMRYTAPFLLTSGSVSFDSKEYLINNLHTPEESGGHQPYGYDQAQVFFNHYVVLGARATVNFTTAELEETYTPIVVGMYLADDTTNYSDYTTMIESKKGVHMLIPHQQNPKKTLSFNYSTKKFFNVVDVKDNLDRLGAAFESSPTEGANLVVYAQSCDRSSFLPNIQGYIVIDYIVALSEPKDLAPS